METVDDEVTVAALKFMENANSDGKPFLRVGNSRPLFEGDFLSHLNFGYWIMSFFSITSQH